VRRGRSDGGLRADREGAVRRAPLNIYAKLDVNVRVRLDQEVQA
jgi:hypothetical protein